MKTSSWRQKIYQNIKITSWHQNLCKLCHDVKNTSWRLKVCHDIKKYVISHDVKPIGHICLMVILIRFHFKNILATIWHFHCLSLPSYRWSWVVHIYLDHHLDLWQYNISQQWGYQPGYHHIKFCHDVKAIDQMQFLFVFVLRISWHQSDTYVSIMFCFTFPVPFDLYRDVSLQCRYHTRLSPYKLMVWCRAADTHIHTHMSHTNTSIAKTCVEQVFRECLISPSSVWALTSTLGDVKN